MVMEGKVGVRQNLETGAWHLHDEARVPMTGTPAPVKLETTGTRAMFRYRYRFECPQCHAEVIVDTGSLDEVEVDIAGVSVSFYHSGPTTV